MYTLNQIVNKLRAIANSHYQIKSFGFGDSWELEADGAKNAPVMWVISRGFTIEEKALIYNFNVLFMDLVDKDERNETEVLSDQTQVATDVLALLDKEAESDVFTIVKNNTGEYFTERFDNEWAGVFIDLSIRVNFTRNWCQVPTIDITPSEPYQCADATLLLNGGSFTSVSSGATVDIILVDTNGDEVTPSSVSGTIITVPPSGGGSVKIENSDASFTDTANPPVYIIPDETYEVYVDSVLVDSGSFPTLGNAVINIDL
jgi:hypothetical protein